MDLKLSSIILHLIVVPSLFVGEYYSNNETNVQPIIGGRPANIKEFPFLVSINYILTVRLYGHWCGGFLLTPSWVGTAAHCLLLKNHTNLVKYRTTMFFLIAGSANIRNLDLINQLRYPDLFITHPEFTWKGLNNDIGLVKVRVPFHFNENMGLAIFPKKSYTMMPLQSCLLAGWGLNEKNKTSSNLLYVDLIYLPEVFCLLSIKRSSFMNPKGSICTLSRENKTACKGDSGSPLLCDVSDAEGGVLAPDLIDSWRKEGYIPNVRQRKVVGIVSWSWNCYDPNFATVYTDIKKYRSWMSEVVHNRSPSYYQKRIIILLISAMHSFILTLK